MRRANGNRAVAMYFWCVVEITGHAHGLFNPVPPRSTFGAQPRLPPCPSFPTIRSIARQSLKPGAQDCERLNAWLRKKSVLLGEGCAEVTPVDFGLGLAAVRDVDAHTVVIDVPQHAIICEATWSEGMDDAAAAQIQAMLYDAWGWGGGGGGLEVGDALLSVRLLHEKALGDDSAWAPYIAALPQDLSDSPVQWSGEEVKTLLHGLLMADDALALRRAIDSTFLLLDSTCFKVLNQEFPACCPLRRAQARFYRVSSPRHPERHSLFAHPIARRRCLACFRRTPSPSPPGVGPWERASAAAFRQHPYQVVASFPVLVPCSCKSDNLFKSTQKPPD
jgi:hypothetical protein